MAAPKMPFDTITQTLTTWRQMGGSKLTILGGEPTLHPQFGDAIRHATAAGYEHVITTSNGLDPAIRKFRRMTPEDFAYIQISLDGGSATSHDQVRGDGTFDTTGAGAGSGCCGAAVSPSPVNTTRIPARRGSCCVCQSWSTTSSGFELKLSSAPPWS